MASKKTIKKAVKKMHPATIVCGVLFLAVGLVSGYFGCKMITKNDVFEVVGDKEIVLELNSDTIYTDPGVDCVSFGKDISDKVLVDTNMTLNHDGTYTINTSVAGEYYLIYTVDSPRYKDVQKVRVIKVGGDANE